MSKSWMLSLSIVAGVLILCILGVSAFGLELGSIEINGFFSKQKERVRREVYIESTSYNEGKLQQLSKYYYEYNTGDDADKMAIKSVVRMQFAGYSDQQLSVELKQFINECNN